jgi:hypothetical protein
MPRDMQLLVLSMLHLRDDRSSLTGHVALSVLHHLRSVFWARSVIHLKR